jgi:hypothetical protein
MAIVVATTSIAHADETPNPKPKDHNEWLAPLVLAGTGAGAMALANAEGMDWGRVAIDSSLASVGFGVGMGLGYWLVRTNNQSIEKLIWGVAVVTAASTLGGIGLGEAISGREPFPKGTGWPATGGLAVGIVVDLGTIVAVMNAKHDQALMIVTMVLLPIVVGATSVAGFSLALPK